MMNGHQYFGIDWSFSDLELSSNPLEMSPYKDFPRVVSMDNIYIYLLN